MEMFQEMDLLCAWNFIILFNVVTIIIVVFIIAKMIFENIKLDVNVIITILVPQSQSI